MNPFLTRQRFAKAVVGILAAMPMLTASGLWLPTAHAQSNGAFSSFLSAGKKD